MAGAGAGVDQGPEGSGTPGAAGPGDPEDLRDWAGLPEHLLMKVAGKHVAQTKARWAAQLDEEYPDWGERWIQEFLVEREREGNCLFVFALVCKGWRKAQLKVGGPLCTRVYSDVILPGQVALAKWALVEGCPRETEKDADTNMYPLTSSVVRGPTMASAAAQHGHRELVQWLCGEGGFEMDEVVMMWAAFSGNLQLVQWLRAEGCPWDGGTCYDAVDQGHVEVLRWARQNGCPWFAETRDYAARRLGYTDDFGNLVELSLSDDEYSDEYSSDEDIE